MRTLALALALALLAPFAGRIGAARAEAADPAAARDPLDRFFERHVSEGRVDYGAIRARDRHELDSLITRLAGADTARWAPARRMALHFDLYDLVMIRAVVDRWKPGWTPAADGFAVFKDPLVPTRRGPISLDQLEKDRTLAVFKDPRAHVAFNCAARSCPPLPSWAWSTHVDEMDRRLDERLAALLHGAEVDPERRVIRLPRLLDWYAADFGGRAGVLRLIARELGVDASRWKLEYLDYDWALNAATYPDGSRPR